MSKLKGKNKKFGRCHVHGQGCEVCSEIRSGYVNRKTEKHSHLSFEERVDGLIEKINQMEPDEFVDYFLSKFDGCKPEKA